MKNLVTLLVVGAALFLISSTGTNGYEIGDTATDFSLMNVDRSMVSMADYEDADGYIIIFTCNTCPVAVRYEDRIIQLHNKWANNGYPVIAINPNDPTLKPGDSFKKMQQRAAEKNFPFPYVFDADQTIFPQYGATKTPHVYLLDDQKVVRYIGAIDDNPRSADGVEINYVDSAILAIQAGDDPDPNFTKAIGCSIKFKPRQRKG